jgi:hypothetical protein
MARRALFVFPATHKLGMRVPHGGSSCAVCTYGRMRADGPHCIATGWIDFPKARGGGGGRSHLPVTDPLNYCCDLFQPSKARRGR